jgi:hypothetical protein
VTGTTPGGGQIRNTMSTGGKVDFGDGGFMGGFLHAGAAVNKVREIVLNTHPDRVKTAGEAYTAISNRTYTTLDTVHTQAQAMVQHWSGKDAEACLKQMQKMYDQAYEIYDKSTTTGSALTDHAEKLQWYKDHVPGGGAVNGVSGGEAVLGVVSPAGLAIKDSIFGSDDDNAAKEFMQHLQQRTTEANDAFPTDIRNDQALASYTNYTPNPNGGGPHGPGVGGGGGGGGGVPKDPFGKGSGVHTPNDPFGHNGTHTPGDPFGNGGHGGNDPFGGGSGTNLAGFDPSGGGGPGLAGGGGGFGGDPLGGAGSGALGGANGLGAGGGVGGGLGAGAGAGAGGAGMAGRGMMPMAPGHGQGEKERERSTWLTEDEDVWGGDGDAAPPLIG